MSDTTTVFTVPAVAQAVAAAIPDRELLIQGERRYSYGQVIERSNPPTSTLAPAPTPTVALAVAPP